MINHLAVPFHGAMALKQDTIPCAFADVELAVPFHGAMALKLYRNTDALTVVRACSPLPRGDGAETACGSLIAAAQELLQSPSTGRWR